MKRDYRALKMNRVKHSKYFFIYILHRHEVVRITNFGDKIGTSLAL